MPTVTIGDNTTDDFNGSIETDANIDTYPAANIRDADMQFSGWDNPAPASDGRCVLLAFPGLSNISGPATVSAAAISVYVESGGGYSHTVYLERLLRDWGESTATWHTYDGTNSWGAQGAAAASDIDSTPTDSGTFFSGASNGSRHTMTNAAGVGVDVEDFINGDEANYGWRIGPRANTGDYSGVILTTGLGTDGNRPQLEVTYTAAGVSAALGQISDTETAQAITPVQPVSLAQASQTDTAQGVTSSKARAFAQSTDTETAQAIAASKAQSLETASEASTANAIGKGKAKAAETALQSDTAQGITPAVPNELLQASDTETAQVLTPTQPSTIAQASDTETAQGLTSSKARAFAQVTDTQSAQVVTPILLHVLEQANDNETAQGITSAKALRFAQAIDTQSANAITYAVPTSYIPPNRYLLVSERIRSIKAAKRIRSVKP